jgi:hypothetical protein
MFIQIDNPIKIQERGMTNTNILTKKPNQYFCNLNWNKCTKFQFILVGILKKIEWAILKFFYFDHIWMSPNYLWCTFVIWRCFNCDETKTISILNNLDCHLRQISNPVSLFLELPLCNDLKSCQYPGWTWESQSIIGSNYKLQRHTLLEQN